MKTLMLLGILFIIVSSCVTDQKKNTTLPSVIGSAGEMLVVIDKAKWESDLGDTIRSVFSAPLQISTQTEPFFNLVQIQESNLSSLFKKHRNILYITIKPKQKVNFGFKEDVWASPQLIAYVNAPSKDSLVNMIIKDGNEIRRKFVLKEIDRWKSIFLKSFNSKETSELKTKQHYWVNVPKGYSLDVNKPGFIWISSEDRENTLGIIGWDYPYKSKDQLTLSNLIKKRDEVLKINVPGPVEKSFMKTETLITPIFGEFVYKGRYFVKMEGLWKLENAFMGGPFVSLTTIDDKNKRIITVEGFIYAPRKEKRNMLRQLEAVLYTIQIE